jgi:kynureninase
MEQGYERNPGIAAWLSGTPNVLGLTAVEEGARLTAEATIPAIAAKAAALTEYAIELHDELLAPLGFTVGSPRDSARRGGHVSVRRNDARELCAALAAAGVITDFRMPDTVRLGCSPLTTSFAELYTGIETLRRLAGDDA